MRTGIIVSRRRGTRELAISAEIESPFSHKEPNLPSAGESASQVNFAAADEEAALSPEDRQLACLAWDG
jgi:P pilus assembly chaperone PapD